MNPFKRKNDQALQAVILDTSGIIDGRIIEIAKAGFIPQNVVVPQFVIAELQFLADNGDSHKRERARYGLDVIRELQDVRRITVSIARNKLDYLREVDDKLVALAKQHGAMLYTTDFNLNKVAQIEGIIVLNVNELAQALRPNLLPGERVTIKLTQVGQDKTQGVGYLGDGTMVVVEQAGRLVGQQVQAVCTRILQTQAGKMMFATLASNPKPTQSSHEHPKPKEVKPLAGRPQVYHAHPPRQQTEKKHVDHPQENAAQAVQPHPRPQHKPQQHAAKPSSAQPQQQSRQAKPQNRSRKQRLSPEDSLLATLKEIER